MGRMLGRRGGRSICRAWDKMFRHVWKQLAARVRRRTNRRDRVSEETGDPGSPAARPSPATRYVITPRRNLGNVSNERVNHRGGISALLYLQR